MYKTGVLQKINPDISTFFFFLKSVKVNRVLVPSETGEIPDGKLSEERRYIHINVNRRETDIFLVNFETSQHWDDLTF